MATSQTLALGASREAVSARLQHWEDRRFAVRIWERDHTLWAADPEEIENRLGWLDLPETMVPELETFVRFAEEVAAEGTRHIVLLGMGGSSLAPEVYQRTFGNSPDRPELVVLDSTHPDAVRAVDRSIEPASTLFVVASKSGTTLEPLSMLRYFWSRCDTNGDPGKHFIAITDPGSPLAETATRRGFRAVFEAHPDVGGRYSALTAFGLVPAALIGVDLAALLGAARDMADSTRGSGSNPALQLGAALGEMAISGRDKATFFTSPSLTAYPDWVEQLIAESTGKDGVGIIPVAGEPVAPPEVYGNDRLFVYVAYAGDDDGEQAAAVGRLAEAGHPVVTIAVDELAEIGGEMFRAEYAVAAAGAVLRIHPFDQPDVELAKKLAKEAMEPAGGAAAAPVGTRADDGPGLAAAVGELLGAAGPGDYAALQAYLPPTPETQAALQRMRERLRERLGAATTVGIGPRFLHSTGQLHKGGPNRGLFIQIVDEPATDLEVPGEDYTFGRIIAAQAIGDYRALVERGRRILRVNLGSDVAGGLAGLEHALRS